MNNVPVLKYPGSKHSLAKWIIGHIPQHDTYCEPFSGSAAVLFAKSRSRMETINDLSGDVTNFFQVLREQRDELIELIKYTPWAAAEHEICLQPTDDPIERARRFYFRCWASIRPFAKNPSFRRQKVLSRGRNGDRSPMTTAARQFMRTDHLHWYADRLRGVGIEQMDGIELIKLFDYDRAFFYVDPPYPFDTRQNHNLYAHDGMSNGDHERLAAALNNIDGMAIVSGYACELYRDLYEAQGWRRADRLARIDGGKSAVESLWLSPRVAQALVQERRALPLLLETL